MIEKIMLFNKFINKTVITVKSSKNNANNIKIAWKHEYPTDNNKNKFLENVHFRIFCEKFIKIINGKVIKMILKYVLKPSI